MGVTYSKNRLRNDQVRAAVMARELFVNTTGSVFSLYDSSPVDQKPRTGATHRYGVFSYSRMWPIFIYEFIDPNDGVWYENVEEVSQTTSRHCKLFRPNAPCTPMDRVQMLDIWDGGLAYLMVQQARRDEYARCNDEPKTIMKYYFPNP